MACERAAEGAVQVGNCGAHGLVAVRSETVLRNKTILPERGSWSPPEPVAIKRAFANVIDNAVKYGTRARIALRDEAHRIVVTIDDDGPGIPEDEQAKVFDPFYRGGASRSRETGGTGLGLTLARTVIRAHGRDMSWETATLAVARHRVADEGDQCLMAMQHFVTASKNCG